MAILADYQYTIVHKPATNGIIKVADALSRPFENTSSMPVAELPNDEQNNSQNLTHKSLLLASADEQNNKTPKLTKYDPNDIHNDEKFQDTIHQERNLTKANQQDLDDIQKVFTSQEQNPNHDTLIDTQHDNMHTLDEQEHIPIDTSRQDEVLLQYTSTIAQAQNSDKDIKRLKHRLTNSSIKTDLGKTLETPLVKYYWSHRSKLKIENDIIYFFDNKNRPRIIVPRSKINELLKLAHNDKTAGHRSAGKMVPLLRAKYHWFKLRGDVELYVKRCYSCGAHKKPKRNRPKAPLFMTKVSSKFERLSVDFAGPFNKTKRGNKYIFLGICCFTKFGFAIPISSTESEFVARILIERWITYFGCPLEIHSDKGSNLISQLIKSLYKLLGIKHSHSLAYVPQQNGAAEKLVSTMKNMMCHFAASKPREWDDVAPLVVLAYNNQVSESTKCIPQEMAMGEIARVSLDLVWGPPPIVEDLDEPDYVAWLRDTMYDIHDYALKTLSHTIQTTKDRFDKGQFGSPYKKDDLVWKLKGRFETGSRKFQRKYEGIFIVLEKQTNVSYLIQHLKTHKKEIVHFNRLKRAYLDPLTLESFLQDLYPQLDHQPEQDQQDDEETILIGFRNPPEERHQQPQLPNENEPQIDQREHPDINPPPLPPRINRRPRVVVRNYNLRSGRH